MKHENAEIAKRLSHKRRKDKRRKWCTVVPSKPCVKCYRCDGRVPVGVEK